MPFVFKLRELHSNMVTKSQQFIIGYHLFQNNSFVCSRFKHNSYMCRRFKINSFVWSRTMKLHPWMNTKPHLWLQCEHLPGCMICVTIHVCPSTHPWHKTDLCLTIMLNIPSGSHSKMESLPLMVSLWSHASLVTSRKIAWISHPCAHQDSWNIVSHATSVSS